MVSTQDLISQLDANFHDSSLKKGKVKKSIHKTFDSGTELVGWKFNEWDYGKPNRVTLPTQARGLFTTNEKIVVRGYDKFFNIDEVAATKWDYIQANTTGPYEVTLKENGCILFISGLETGELVVCSKHSTGFRDDVNKNHAEYGYGILHKQLHARGINATELGTLLYERELTAVAELCDDDFEEHVLQYAKEDSGLYLHGLNKNVPEFITVPMENVYEFADKFGFRKVDYFKENNLERLKQFMEKCAITGTYKGKEVEGFVIRSKLVNVDCNFFFKYKFEEPYLMYRQWREATKALIQGKSVFEININKHKYQTLKYIEFVLPLLKEDAQLQEDYISGHRIIELREAYLQHIGKSGYELANADDNLAEFEREIQSLSINSLSISEKKNKYVLVPVATIGCGKTTVALSLTRLFPEWTHIQNDNIKSPAKDKLVRGALELLENSPCCFVDRNNHQYRERKQLFDDFQKVHEYAFSSSYKLKFICLNFVTDKFKMSDRLWDITSSRVMDRGDNHQSIKSASDDKGKVDAIMKGFIGRFQAVNPTKEPDSLFNMVIDLNLDDENSSLSNLKQVVSYLAEKCPDLVQEIPSASRIEESFQYALNYQPTIHKFIKDRFTKTKAKVLKPTYFALTIKNSAELLEAVDDLLLTSTNDKVKVMYQCLKQLDRIQPEFHVTLVHINAYRNGSPAERQLYQDYIAHFSKELEQANKSNSPNPVPLPLEKSEVKLKRVCCTNQVMCIEVSLQLLLPDNKPFSSANKYPHVTVGTVDSSIKPYISNKVIESIQDFNCAEQDGYFQQSWDESVIFATHQLQLNAFR